MAEKSERRKWPRLEVALKIRLRPVEEGEAGEEQSCHTKNISTGGLFFEGARPASLADAAVLDVEISMPLAKYGFSPARRLEARGRVCRVEEAQGASVGGVALEFVSPPRFVTP